MFLRNFWMQEHGQLKQYAIDQQQKSIVRIVGFKSAGHRWLIIKISNRRYPAKLVNYCSNKKIFWQWLNLLKIYFGKAYISPVSTGYDQLVSTHLFAQPWHELVTPFLAF